MRVSRRAMVATVFGLVAFVLASQSFTEPALAAEPAKPKIKIKVGHLVALDMAPLFVAKEAGLFAKYGLEVETVFFANPGDNNAALAGGAIDLSINPFTLPFFAANSKVPIRVLAAAGGWGVMQVVADGKLGIKSFRDMAAYIKKNPQKKLKVGTLQGDTLELILTRSFAKDKISINDVQMVYFNDLLAMVDAFRTGQVDILSHIKPYTTDLVVRKGAVVMADNASVWSRTTPNCVLSTLEKTLKERPNVVEAYLNAVLDAAALINSDPQKVVALLQKGTYYRVSPEVVLKAFQSAPAPISFVPDVAAVQGVVSDLTKMGYIKGTTNAKDIFRTGPIEALEKARVAKK
jgi:ABC-type nitrate/sulfonate/bicarbonate transport system substrate-binding protein